MAETQALLVYGALAVAGLLAARQVLRDRELAHIPIVHGNATGLLASYRDALKFDTDAPDLAQRGYDLYPNGVFRLSRKYLWQYVVTGKKLVKEIGNIPEETLSFIEGVEETIQSRITMGAELQENPFHLNAVRTSLTRNLHTCFPDVRDEIVCAFNDVLDVQGSDWKAVYVIPTMMNIVARISNRLFVGLPLCRNQEYLDNNVKYTIGVFSSAKAIGKLPPFLRPILGPWMTTKNQSFDVAMRLLGPLVADRIRKDDELGPEWLGRPNDMISWLLDIADESNRTVEGIVLRILSVNMAAIHTSSMAFTHMLYSLATFPPSEYFLPMRAEAERVVASSGWTKAALGEMHLIDSFLRESQRFSTNGPLGMNRRVMKREGLVLSNGVRLPYGAHVCVAARPMHYDPGNYDDPDVFDGFRFARERQAQRTDANFDPSKEVFGRQMITTGPEHLPFGTGKHACPGRFFAATELKAMLAHLVINYDVKAEVEGVRPPDDIFGMRISPNPRGKVLLRKRVD
uniref:Cytochrome P450 n=1 Tax=Mycena chlorophos TaxID=658473 RepID=A0ABQ0L1L7_MYCCL|nr:predicted protein [Mycena chlorophos]